MGCSAGSPFVDMRSEQEIFDDLAKLCASPGYAHALASISYKDNFIGYLDEIAADDLLKKYSWDRLIRTELMTLVGLLLKADIDYALPNPDVHQLYIDDTYRLLEELHRSMSSPLYDSLTPEKIEGKAYDALTEGQVLREPIFYSGESAYSFQFRDLAVRKYRDDNAWLKQQKGFSIDDAREVALAFTRLQNEKVAGTLRSLKELDPREWSLLPGFSITAIEIATHAAKSKDLVEQVLGAFCVPLGERNQGFQSLHDFNVATATPLLRKDEGTFILFEQYSLVQALYDAPFYWMGADRSYVNTAMKHRGEFTEQFARERLERVFGPERVFPNVEIHKKKGRRVTDIDVLVIFSNRAIVLQAKSKRLTLEARRGNDGQIRDDFKKGVQDAYDQGYKAAKCLCDSKYRLLDQAGNAVSVPSTLKEVYIVCVVSDFYPALSFQALHFLKHEETTVIKPPIVTDVFALDAMTEMLETPLHFVSYINKRTGYSHKLFVPDELTALSFHLKQNLWLENEYDVVQLSDDISCNLDAAMTVRREGLPGKRTPDGILTKFQGTTLERILKEIESQPNGPAVDFAFVALTFSEETFLTLSDGIDRISQLAKDDGRGHDFSIASKPVSTGVTIHCNDDSAETAYGNLRSHCENRKYMQRADKWFGLCIKPDDKSVRFGLELDYKWAEDPAMSQRTKSIRRRIVAAKGKVGRNDPCPCGSGRKYKKCCLE